MEVISESFDFMKNQKEICLKGVNENKIDNTIGDVVCTAIFSFENCITNLQILNFYCNKNKNRQRNNIAIK